MFLFVYQKLKSVGSVCSFRTGIYATTAVVIAWTFQLGGLILMHGAHLHFRTSCSLVLCVCVCAARILSSSPRVALALLVGEREREYGVRFAQQRQKASPLSLGWRPAVSCLVAVISSLGSSQL